MGRRPIVSLENRAQSTTPLLAIYIYFDLYRVSDFFCHKVNLFFDINWFICPEPVVGADDGPRGSAYAAFWGVDSGSVDGDYDEIFENPDNLVSDISFEDIMHEVDLLDLSVFDIEIDSNTTAENDNEMDNLPVLRGQGIKPEKLKGVPAEELVQRLLTDR